MQKDPGGCKQPHLESETSVAQAAPRPNILFFFPDQHRFDWLGTTPDLPVHTPNLNALAARGVRFTQVLTPSPLCAPARACLAAGKEYPRCRVADNKVDYPLDQPTFYASLRDVGYHVAGCGKFDLHKASYIWGLDGKNCLAEWGFSDGIDNEGKLDAVHSGRDGPRGPYMAYLYRRGLAQVHIEDFRRHQYRDTHPTPLPEEAYCDNWVAHNGLTLMSRFPKGKPWFLQVNFTGPHSPMDITARMERLCRNRHFPLPNGNTQYDAATHNAIRQNYSAMVENIDRWVGIYLEELKRRGEEENTLIVYSSDHGEMLGDHNQWGKTKPFHPSVAVPLIIAGPGVVRGVVSHALVSLMDLAATFLDYAGAPPLPGMESRSLRPLLEGRTHTHRPYVVSALRTWRLVFDGRYKFIHGFGPDEAPLLFDLQNDPLENENLAERAQSEVERLQALLEQEFNVP